jgi:hypothetical protein
MQGAEVPRKEAYSEVRWTNAGQGQQRRWMIFISLTGGSMGRTVLPFSQVLEREYDDWKKFRRGLRKEDQAVLDRLFDLARLHVQAGVYASRPWPLETILVSILIEQEKSLAYLRKKFKLLYDAVERKKEAIVAPGLES